MAEQIPPHQDLPALVGQSGRPGAETVDARLDYQIPFTLQSPEMAKYIATMSVRQQEALELEIAQKRERIDLQKAREAEAARRAQVKRDIEQCQTSLLTMDDKSVEPTRTQYRESVFSLPAAPSSSTNSQGDTLDDRKSGLRTTIETSHSNTVVERPLHLGVSEWLDPLDKGILPATSQTWDHHSELSVNQSSSIEPPRPDVRFAEDLKALLSELELRNDAILHDLGTGKSSHSGELADVHIGSLRTEDGALQKVAIKVLRISSTMSQEEIESLDRHFNREVVVWHKLNQSNHSNVLKLLGVFIRQGHGGYPALVSPYCDGGTITEYLKHHPDEDRMGCVARGLVYLHSMGIVHGDVEPSNILVDAKGIALLCGFGNSDILIDEGFPRDWPAGTFRYMAPEILLPPPSGKYPRLTKAMDVYAFALSSFEIWSGEVPYKGLDSLPAVWHYVTVEGKRPVCPNPAPPHSAIVWPLLEQCWAESPSKRLTMEEVVQKLESSFPPI